MLLKKHFILPLVLCAANCAMADTIQLKDSDAVTGKILVEKPDSVVVDVGYTVLVVPRTAISGITRSGNLMTPSSPGGPLLDVTPEFYTAGTPTEPASNKSE